MAATLALSPIVWLHYLVVLLVPMAIARPRFSLLWLLPVVLWVSPRPGYPEGFTGLLPGDRSRDPRRRPPRPASRARWDGMSAPVLAVDAGASRRSVFSRFNASGAAIVFCGIFPAITLVVLFATTLEDDAVAFDFRPFYTAARAVLAGGDAVSVG